MKTVDKVLYLTGSLALVIALSSSILGLDGDWLTVLTLVGLGALYSAWVKTIISNVQDYKKRTTGKKISVRYLIFSVLGSALWGQMAQNFISSLTSWHPSVIFGVIGLMVIIPLFLQLIALRKDNPDFRQELAIAKNDERLVANRHRAGYYVMLVMNVALYASAFILALTVGDVVGPWPFIMIIMISSGSMALFFALNLLFEQKDQDFSDDAGYCDEKNINY